MKKLIDNGHRENIDTFYPAILTKNIFQDNPSDVDFLLSEAGKQAIVNLHVQGILLYMGTR